MEEKRIIPTDDFWYSTQEVNTKSFTCAYCDNTIAPNKGYNVYKKDKNGRSTNAEYGIRICPLCQGPNFIAADGTQIPGIRYGKEVKYLPKDIDIVYNEIRDCYKSNCFTACVMMCRKLLIHIAVEKGADLKDNKGHTNKFIDFVNHLKQNNYLPNTIEGILDKIRDDGNEANHSLNSSTEKDAHLLIYFVQLVLQNLYEVPEELNNN